MAAARSCEGPLGARADEDVARLPGRGSALFRVRAAAGRCGLCGCLSAAGRRVGRRGKRAGLSDQARRWGRALQTAACSGRLPVDADYRQAVIRPLSRCFALRRSIATRSGNDTTTQREPSTILVLVVLLTQSTRSHSRNENGAEDTNVRSRVSASG